MNRGRLRRQPFFAHRRVFLGFRSRGGKGAKFAV
jgi:hypothetical protein